jgi:hypothetical protein
MKTSCCAPHPCNAMALRDVITPTKQSALPETRAFDPTRSPIHMRSQLRQLTAQALRHAPGPTAAAPSTTLAVPAAALAALRDADTQGQASSSPWRMLVAAAAGACGAAVAACESSNAVPSPSAPASQHGLLSRETRLRAFYDYERRLRERSGPDKVCPCEGRAKCRRSGAVTPPYRRRCCSLARDQIFEYFASVRGKDASFMVCALRSAREGRDPLPEGRVLPATPL